MLVVTYLIPRCYDTVVTQSTVRFIAVYSAWLKKNKMKQPPPPAWHTSIKAVQRQYPCPVFSKVLHCSVQLCSLNLWTPERRGAKYLLQTFCKNVELKLFPHLFCSCSFTGCLTTEAPDCSLSPVDFLCHLEQDYVDSAKDLSISLNIGIFVSELKKTWFTYVIDLGSCSLIYLDVISICAFC